LIARKQLGRSVHEIEESRCQNLVARSPVEISVDECDDLFEHGDLLAGELVTMETQPPRDVRPHEVGPLFGRDSIEERKPFRPTHCAEGVVVDGHNQAA